MTTTPLYEVTPIRLELEEAASGSGRVVVKGEFGRCGVPTANKRVYGRDIIESNIKNLSEGIERRRVFGELDHPQDGRTSLQRVSHVITSLEVNEDGMVIGRAEILDTPNGKALQAIVRANCEVGVSSRGLGSTVAGKDGNEEVQNDFVLKTYDFVADPATRTAYPQVVREAIEEAEACLCGPLTFEGIPADIKAMFLEEAKELVRPDLEEAAKTAEQVAREEAVRAAVDAEIGRLKVEYAAALPEQLAEIKQSLRASLLEELQSDPAIAGSKRLVEKIVELVRPLLTPELEAQRLSEKDDDVTALKDALADKDLLIANLHMEMEEQKRSAVLSEIRAELASRVAGHPKALQIRKMVGAVEKLESVEELLGRLDPILEELGTPEEALKKAASGEDKSAEFTAQIESLNGKVSALTESETGLRKDLAAANAKLESNGARLKEAVDLGLLLDARVFAAEKAAGRPDALRILQITESCRTREEVTAALDKIPSFSVQEDVTDRVRARVRRGMERDLDEEVTPTPRDTTVSGLPTWMNVSQDRFNRLAGVASPTPSSSPERR